MGAESLVMLVAFLWGGLVLYRIHKRRQARGASRPAVVERAADQPREMPRVGAPGTITYNQIKALHRNNFVPDKSWSREEAAVILDAVKYLRAVCRDIAGNEDGPPPIEVQNHLLRFVLTEQDIRDHVRKWGAHRRAAGLGDYADDEPVLSRNNQYLRVEAEAARFLTVDEAAPSR